jgi:transcriptional regulator with PAS, ATPase and Fis domain
VAIGVLELVNALDQDSQTVVSFPPDREELVEAFASQAAVAIDNVQLIEENDRLINILDTTNKQLEQENVKLRDKIQSRYRFSKIIGESLKMQQVFSLMEKILDSDATILITGETGCGKELIAQAIHYNGRFKGGEFVALNCAALPENLLESELFGYAAGAFTGATKDKKGLMEIASGGTLFLDEIADMPAGIQAKLLRALQEGEIRPLGSTKSVRIAPRIIAATNCDLREMVAHGRFREDLYYRLCIFPIELPPLRERTEDLPALLQHFLNRFSKRYEKEISGFAPAALEILLQYDYPGNVRELKNLVERMVLLVDTGRSILPDAIPEHVREKVPHESSTVPAQQSDGRLKEMVKEYEASLIRDKLALLNWNQTKAAEELNIPRRTLIDKIKRYHIKRPHFLRSRSDHPRQ